MQPRIEHTTDKKLIGIKLEMSLANNQTAMLWKSFMPRRNEIQHRPSSDLISMTVYNVPFDFNPHTAFDKWAAVEVTAVETIPAGMESFVIPAGTYAVFDYKGSSADPSIFQYIFGTWLPGSEWIMDHRPRFEVLGAKYKNNDPDSEEEIWIPVTQKQR